MKRIFAIVIIVLSCMDVAAQNVGVGTTTPGFPLNFSNALGDKISLYGNTGNHYGFGIQGGLLQMHSDAAAANIGFGYGSSAAFTERMRIINSGGDGLLLSGRITLRNGTIPVDPNYGSGVWLYNAANTSVLGFMGVENNQNIGFYGGPLNNGWGFTYDAINSRVGIGTSTPTASLMLATNMNPQLHIRQTNTADYARIRMQTGTNRYWDIAGYNDANTIANERLNFFNSQAGDILSITGNGFVGIGNNNPNAALAFAPSLGKKITLYPGATGDAGLGMAGNRLQIYADNPNADVAIGYDAAGIFNERFAVKPNGALAIIGNTGTAGAVLTSNGNSNPAEWGSPTKVIYNSTIKIDGSNTVLISNNASADLPGLTYTFTTTSNTKVIVNFNIPVWTPSCALCGWSKAFVNVNLNGTNKSSNSSFLPNDESFTISGSALLQLSPGTHTIKLVGYEEGPSAWFGASSSYIYHNEMILQIIPE